MTEMGRAVFDSCLPTAPGKELYQRLSKLRRTVLLGDSMHLILTLCRDPGPFQARPLTMNIIHYL